LFIPRGRLSWLLVSFLLHVKYTLSFEIGRPVSSEFLVITSCRIALPVVGSLCPRSLCCNRSIMFLPCPSRLLFRAIGIFYYFVRIPNGFRWNSLEVIKKWMDYHEQI